MSSFVSEGSARDGFQELGRVERAVSSLSQYHFRLESGNGVTFDGQVMRGTVRRYYQIFSDGAQKPMAEVFWTDDGGIGHKLNPDTWFRLTKRPATDYLELALNLLKEFRIESVSEEGPDWQVRFVPWKGEDPNDPVFRIKNNPERFFDDSLKGLFCCLDEQENRRKFVRAARDLQMNAQLLISRENYLIRKLELKISWQNTRYKVKATFGPSTNPIPMPRPAGKVVEGIEIPEGMLIFTLPSLGGWMDNKTHSPWAQRSLDLITKKDTEKKYEELYAKNNDWGITPFTETLARSGDTKPTEKNHPIVLGACYEDETQQMPQFMHTWFKSDPNYKSKNTYYFPSGAYMRDCHHYGYATDTGLKYEWYFEFRGTTPRTTKPVDDGGYYYSNRDWGYGYGRINEDLNRMTFTEAIKQYYRFSEEGKRNAYLMLGFVVHLLQDAGHPDHAAIVCHPASGYNGEEFLLDKGYCKWLSVEVGVLVAATCFAVTPWPFDVACPLVGLAAGGIAFGICKSLADSDNVGYERLVGDNWDVSKKLEKTIESAGILTQKNYDSYFKDLGDFSLAILSKYPQLKHALGCTSLTLPPITVPNSNPAIDSDDPVETKPYFDYTDQIVPRIIGTTAGFIEYFYQIVNYPPYLERMAIVQWESGDKPRKFAFFKDDSKQCVRYDAEWVQGTSGRTINSKVAKRLQKLSLDRPAYVFLLFGPSQIGPLKGGKQMDKLEVKIEPKYAAPSTVQAKETMTMTLAHDDDVGYYYWGAFTPKNCGIDPYILCFKITAQDKAPHLEMRNPSGKDLDSNPATIAIVNSTKAPTYPFTGYEPGTDTNHEIWVAPFNWNIEVTPKSHQNSIGQKATATYILEVKQKAWDCQWEETSSPPRCPVQWKLQRYIKLKQKRGKTGRPQSFGMKISFDTRTIGKATLTVTPIPRKCKPGKYEMYVDYSVGQIPGPKTGTITLKLQIK